MDDRQPRDLRQRTVDTLARLDRDVDGWVATANAGTGMPYLIPLSFLWDGAALLFATPTASPTIRNLRQTAHARVGIGPTRDLVLVEGSVTLIDIAGLAADRGDEFAAKAGFDPRELTTTYTYFELRPARVQAWREADELAGRDLMRAGQWIFPDVETVRRSAR